MSWPILNKASETSKIIVIDTAHREVHEGHAYQASHKTVEGGDLADNAALRVLVRTGDRYPHMIFAGSCGGNAEANLFEGTVASNNGTAMTSNNVNRNGIMTPSVQVSHTPTVTGAGFELHNTLMPGGSGPHAGGGSGRSESEWVLAPNTNYLVEIINRSGNAAPASIMCHWYEEE